MIICNEQYQQFWKLPWNIEDLQQTVNSHQILMTRIRTMRGNSLLLPKVIVCFIYFMINNVVRYIITYLLIQHLKMLSIFS